MIQIRDAEPADFDLIAEFIRKLADYENLAHEVCFDPEVMRAHLFGECPAAEVLIAEIDGRPAGFALYFQTFSTFEGRPGIYLEDLFVDPDARDMGIGRALLARLAEITIARDGRRLEWSVLDWNELGKGFYSWHRRSVGRWMGAVADRGRSAAPALGRCGAKRRG